MRMNFLKSGRTNLSCTKRSLNRSLKLNFCMSGLSGRSMNCRFCCLWMKRQVCGMSAMNLWQGGCMNLSSRTLTLCCCLCLPGGRLQCRPDVQLRFPKRGLPLSCLRQPYPWKPPCLRRSSLKLPSCQMTMCPLLRQWNGLPLSRMSMRCRNFWTQRLLPYSTWRLSLP